MVLIRTVAVAGASVFLLAACGGGAGDSRAGGGRRPQVVAAFYPLAEVARQVGGRHVRVHDLTPPGAEPHDLELRPSQVERVRDAELVVVMGGGFQPSLERAAAARGDSRGVLQVLQAVLGDEAKADGVDPHVWLDPELMIKVVAVVRSRIRAAVPASAQADVDANAAAYAAKVGALDERYRAGLAQCARRELVTSHAAFGRLAARYGLVQEAIAGISPEAEPTPGRMSQLADYVRARGVTTIFTEQLVSRRVAQALARETGVRTDVLDPIEGLTSTQVKAGRDYLSAMDTNLAKLRAALGCA